MHIILLSGGSGKRLWPLSNDVQSKQFISILPGPNGTKESMVQRVYRQLNDCGVNWDSITVSGSQNQKDLLTLHLGSDVNVVLEPERRNTFPAIALACAYLNSEKKVSEDEPVVICPVDPFVDTSFFERIAKLEDVVKNNNCELALMGVTPTYPSVKYGYIVPNEPAAVMSVKQFKEKPEVEEAEALIEQGALWNCGVFCFKLGYILEKLRKEYEFQNIDFDTVYNHFAVLKKDSFDYEVVEKAKKICAIEYSGTWKDLGTWATFTEEIPDQAHGNVSTEGDCTNTHIINNGKLPLVVMGVQDAVVVSSNDGILVAAKNETEKLKSVQINAPERPMFEQRRWGNYYVLEYITYSDGNEMLTKRLHLNAGKGISYQYHLHRKEIWTIVSGSGELCVNDKITIVHPGDVIPIAEGDKHSIKAINDLELIEVQLGGPLVEEDIFRME